MEDRRSRIDPSIFNPRSSILDLRASVRFANFDAAVVSLQDLFKAEARQRHAKGADLAQADTMPPTAAIEGKALNLPLRVPGPGDGEKGILQTERASDAVALQDLRSASAGNA